MSILETILIFNEQSCQWNFQNLNFGKGGLQKKKSKLRDIDPKGREGSEKNQFFSLIIKRENYLGGEGLNPKVPFYLGILLVNFEYFL